LRPGPSNKRNSKLIFSLGLDAYKIAFAFAIKVAITTLFDHDCKMLSTKQQTAAAKFLDLMSFKFKKG
jgi:hypothetical protein